MKYSNKNSLTGSLIISFFFLLFSCSNKTNEVVKSEKMKVRTDLTHSYSNTSEVHTTHLHLDLEVRFDDKLINGVARHSIINKGSDTVIFDVKNLNIQKVTSGKKGERLILVLVLVKTMNYLGLLFMF